jgi:phospholipid/cholesterol/gamma-HCH transport system substrate-binding protein
MSASLRRLGRDVLVPLTKLVVFAVVTVVTTVLLAATIANTGTGFDATYTARFTDVTNLNEGDDVRVAGVRVGQVTDIRIVDRRLAEVEFSFDPGQRITSTTTAVLKFRNLVGQRYVALEQKPGDVGELLREGDTIPVERTRPAVDLTALFNGFKPLIRALDPEAINTLSYEIVQVLQGEGGTVRSLLGHTAALANTIADRDRVIGEVIANLNQVLDTINGRGDQVSELVVTLQQLVSGLAQDREAIGSSIESLGVLSDVTASFLREGREPLRNDIDQLGRFAAGLNENSAILEHTIQFLPEKLTTLGHTVTHGSWFNFYLCDFSAKTGVDGAVETVVPGIVFPGNLVLETPPYQAASSRCRR